MIGQAISHYKIIEKLGEVPTLSAMRKRAETMLIIPANGRDHRRDSI